MKTKLLSLAAVTGLVFSPSILAATYGSTICKTSADLQCYVTKKGDTWEKLFKTPEGVHYGKLLNRIGNSLHRGMTIAMPKSLNQLNYMTIAPFAKQASPTGEKFIEVSLSKLAWGAYDAQGNLVNWGPVSGGRGYCADIHSHCNTPTGKFEIYRTQGSDCKSTKFPVGRGGAPMPYCMFFKGGFALHGSYDIPGYNASHGCVRLMVNDAKWINTDFVQGDNVPVLISRDHS